MREKQKDISFVSTVEGLESLEDCRPRPTKNFLPSWWKEMSKIDHDSGLPTVKSCPAIPDYFSQGYIIPMWADTSIVYDKKRDTWNVKSGNEGSLFSWEIHYNEQALNHNDFKAFGRSASFIFKAISPWRIITKKGWSVYQEPLFYHFDNDFAVLPGVIDTDIHHVINQPLFYLGDGEEIFIKRGQPFVQYIPFKREKSSYEVRQQNKKDSQQFKKMDFNYWTKFSTPLSGVYRKMQRDRDQ